MTLFGSRAAGQQGSRANPRWGMHWEGRGVGDPPPLSLSRAPSLWPSHRLTDRKCQPQWQL